MVTLSRETTVSKLFLLLSERDQIKRKEFAPTQGLRGMDTLPGETTVSKLFLLHSERVFSERKEFASMQ